MGVFQNNLMGAAAAAASAGGGDFYTHQIANSIRNSAAQNGTLQFTAGTPTSSTTFTMSYWVKRYTNTTDGDDTNIFVTGTGGGAYAFMAFGGNTWQFQPYGGSWGTGGGITMNPTALYRDTSAWYHHVIIWDTTQSTQADRVKMYVNGERITSFSTEGVTGNLAEDESLSFINQSGVVQAFGGLSGKGHGTEGADLQMAEIVFNDGQAYGPDSYGETKNGVWIPKDPSGLTFGNNGYYLKFESSSDLGNDSSGNNNDFTVANISAHDQMLDSPTFNSNSNGGNFMTYNGVYKGANNALAEGNLQSTGSSAGNNSGTFGMLTGKWYWECRAETVNSYAPTFGIGQSGIGNTDGQYYIITWQTAAGQMYGGGGAPVGMGTITVTSTGVTSLSSGDILSFWLDCDNKKLWIGKNGTIPNSGDPANGTNPQASWATTPTDRYFTATCQNVGSGVGVLNAGQNPSFNGELTGGDIGTATDKNGYGLFKYDPSGTDFVACCAANIPTTDAVDPAQTDDNFPQKLFSPLLYTGTGSTNALTGLGFQPDLTWIKERGGANDHKLTDSTRGVTKSLESNTTAGEATDSNGLTAFGSDGFTVGSDAVYNNSSDTYVAWNWRANGGTTTTDTSGDIDGVYQTNDCGFSIMKYTGNGSNAQTVPHGITVGGVATAPSYVIMKNLPDSSNNWRNWSIGYDNGDADSYAEFNDSAWLANQGSGGLFTAKPTDTMLTLTDYSAINASGKAVIVYSFANVEGFIKSGSYVGNANDDGVFVYTGFKPAFFMCKPIVTGNWRIQDNKRTPFNVADKTLYPNHSDAEESNSSNEIDLLSNGVKMRASDSNYNQATTFVYLAMAHNPFKYATAR